MRGSEKGEPGSTIRSETDDGVEVLVHEPARESLARRVLAERDAIRAMALRLMVEFLDPVFQENRDSFDLVSIEIFAASIAEDGDFVLRFYYDADRQEFGYTYFDVHFRCLPQANEPVRPFKFTVGFH